MYASIMLLQSDAPAFDGVLAEIPHDPAAIFVYILLLASVVVMWRANRGSSGRNSGASGPDASTAEEEGGANPSKQESTSRPGDHT